MSKSKKFKKGDVVYVSNPDSAYEEEYGVRHHSSFFGVVKEVTEYTNGTVVEVLFNKTPAGCEEWKEWSYDADELSLARELKDMTLEEFSNKFGVIVTAEYVV